MAISIDKGKQLAASPSQVKLPSKLITLRQTLSSDLEAGEPATITYSLADDAGGLFAIDGGGEKVRGRWGFFG